MTTMQTGAGLDGKRVLVTGASRGIGRAVAERLHEEGAVVLAAARSFAGPGGRRSPYGVGRSHHRGGLRCCRRGRAVASRRHRCHRPCSRRFFGASGWLRLLDESQWRKELDLNLFPAIRLDRALLPLMLAQGSGAIVHVTHPGAVARLRGDAGLRRQRRRLRTTAKASKEVSPKGVRVVRGPARLDGDRGRRRPRRASGKRSRLDYATARGKLM